MEERFFKINVTILYLGALLVTGRLIYKLRHKDVVTSKDLKEFSYLFVLTILGAFLGLDQELFSFLLLIILVMIWGSSWYSEHGEWQVYDNKKNEEKRIAKEKVKSLLKKYIDKQIASKNYIWGAIYTNEDSMTILKTKGFDGLKEHALGLYELIELQIEHNDYDDLSEQLNLKEHQKKVLDFLNDCEKLYRLLEKKGVKTSYIEIFRIFSELADELVEKEKNEKVNREYVRIKNIFSKNGKRIAVTNVLKEFIKCPIAEDVDVEIGKLLLDKFGLSIQGLDIDMLFKEIREDIELEEFENELDGKSIKKSVKIISSDFENLDGYQFESFLKELFEKLDYIVAITKKSGDQGADLIITKDGKKTVVQAKRYSGKVPNTAIQEVVAAKKHYKCQEMVVVTTGKFTKSAIELALSNNVELWDKTKLKEKIEEINNTQTAGYHQTVEMSIEDEIFPLSCPYCNSQLKLPVEEMPKINTKKVMECPECGITLKFKIPTKDYICNFCHKKFDTQERKNTHLKKCPKLMERTFTCQFCVKDFILDESEFTEFKKKHILDADCPNCQKKSTLKE